MIKNEQPLNAQERYLYGINARLDAVVDMMSSFIELYAEKQKVTTESHVVEVSPAEVEEEVAPVEVEEEVVSPAPRKRRSKKK